MQTKLHKAPGPDGLPMDVYRFPGLPNWILKDFAATLAGPITSLVNSSIQEAYVPDLWKCADVIPLPKTNPPKTLKKDLRH